MSGFQVLGFASNGDEAIEMFKNFCLFIVNLLFNQSYLEVRNIIATEYSNPDDKSAEPESDG